MSEAYPSRRMAPTDALPRIRKHEDAGRDAGRYGSSRDPYVSFAFVEDMFYSNARLVLSR